MTRQPKMKLLALVLPFELWAGLQALAAAAGTSIEETAEKILAEVVEDDRAAHDAEAA